MARLDALSIQLLDGTTKDKLAEEYGKVIENIQARTLSTRLKNNDLSGDPTSGTVEAKRFANVSGATYGSARNAKAGSKIKSQPVVVSLDDNTEYIEEVESKDLKTYGVNGLIERRIANHGDMLELELETKFFAAATATTTGGTKVSSFTATDTKGKVLEILHTVEKIKNNFVQGVPRNKISIVLSPEWYDEIKDDISSTPNSQGVASMANYEEGIFHNTKIFSSVFLPSGVNAIVMVDGAVAQPIMTSIYDPKEIEFSDAIGFGLFAYKGTKVVTSDLIYYA